jgi:hypothetical protein
LLAASSNTRYEAWQDTGAQMDLLIVVALTKVP